VEPAERSGVLINGRTPNTLRRLVLPPGERNGVDVLGYQVKQDNGVYDFDAGMMHSWLKFIGVDLAGILGGRGDESRRLSWGRRVGPPGEGSEGL